MFSFRATRFSRLAACVVAPACVLMGLALSAAAETYIVRPDGTGDFPSIQAAMAAAVNGDVIELADGIFSGAGNRDVDFLGKAVTVQGQSGNPDLAVVDCAGTPGEPHRAFYFHSGEEAGSVLRHLTVRNGYGSTTPHALSSGGAVYCLNSSPTIEGCIFQENVAEHSGAAVSLDGSDSRIEGCVFRANRILGTQGDAGGGGGIWCWYGSDALIRNCEFTDNSGLGRCVGAAATAYECAAIFDGCTFTGNTVEFWGGAIYTWGEHCFPRFANCDFAENRAENGGAMYLRYFCGPTITGCTFRFNEATVEGGAIDDYHHTRLEMSACTFYANRAGIGSAVFIGYAAELHLSNTIVAFGTSGSAVSCYDATVSLRCCDVFGNVGGDWTGCLQGMLGQDGNVGADPLFCDPANGDLTIAETSPCAPDHSAGCGLIGARPVACAGPTPVELTSWGQIKSTFRGEHPNR